MNRVYRLIWSHTLQALVAVSETSKSRGKSGGRAKTVSTRAAAISGALASAFLSAAAPAALTFSATNALAQNVAITTDTYETVSRGSISSFSNSSLIMTPDTAVKISGDIRNGFTNRGEIWSSSSYGILIDGSLSGGFVNSQTGRILVQTESCYSCGAVTVSGDFLGTFDNAGIIEGYDRHAIVIRGKMTGDFTNRASGRLIARDGAFAIRGGLEGNVKNDGLILSLQSGEVAVGIQGGLVGNIENTESGSIYGDHGVVVSGGFQGNFLNSGDIYGFQSYSLYIRSRMTGDFLNTATGNITAKTTGISNQGQTGNFTNHGKITAKNSDAVLISGSLIGDFTNSQGALILAGQQGVWIKESGGSAYLQGNFSNAGSILGSGRFGGVVIEGRVDGNFTNEETGVIRGGQGSGVVIGSSLAGNFTNAGLIIGSRYFGEALPNSTQPVIGMSRNGDAEPQYYTDDSFQSVFVPDHIGLNPKTGVYINGDLQGHFVNSGTILAAQGVFIDGNLTGNYENTGLIEGGFSGLTITADKQARNSLTGNRSLTNDPVVIAGNFSGNFKTPVGQGVLVGSYLHNWQPGDGDQVAENITRAGIGLKPGTGRADLRGKTLAVHVNQAFESGYTWTAIDAGQLLLDSGLTITDNSTLFDFSYDLTKANDFGDLVITATLTGTPSAVAPSPDSYVGKTYMNPAGFTIAEGSRIVNDSEAVYVSGNVTGDILNHGEIIGVGTSGPAPNAQKDYGIFITGNIDGDLTNSSTGKIVASQAKAAIHVQGSIRNVTNEGEVSAHNGYGVFVGGLVRGDFTNAASGRIYAEEEAAVRFASGDSQAFVGNFTNHGILISQDDYGVFVSGGFRGNFLNSQSGGIYSYRQTLHFGGSFDGNFTNAGELIGREEGIAFRQTMTGNFLNDVTGKVLSASSPVKFYDGLVGNLRNYGQILGGRNPNHDGVLIDGSPMIGDFFNGEAAQIVGRDSGVRINIRLSGDFENHGEITASVTGDSDGGDGVFIESMDSGEFINGTTGSIRGKNNGVRISRSQAEPALVMDGNFTNYGQISSGGAARLVDPSYCATRNPDRPWECDDYVSLPRVLTNFGSGVYIGGIMRGAFANTDTGEITGYDSGVEIHGGLTGSLANAGVIRANAGDGIRLGGTISGTIGNSGSVIGTDGAGIHVTSSVVGGVSGGVVNNSGVIEATGPVPGTLTGGITPGSGVYVAADADWSGITNTETGIIKGSFRSLNLENTANPFEVDNLGVLSGDVYLGRAGNTLNLNGDVARVIGNVSNNGASSTVNVNGTFTSEGTFDVGLFNVNDGGLFNIAHQVTATTTTVKDGGVLNLGSGSRTVVGDYLQEEGGTLRLTLTDASTYGLLTVSGDATLEDGAVVDVVLDGTPGTRIRGVLRANSLITPDNPNTQITVTDNSLLYDFFASTLRNPNQLDLITEVNPNAFTGVATRPTRGIAGALQSMLNQGVPQALEPAFDAMSGMNADELNEAMLQMTPALQGAVGQAALHSSRQINRIIRSRVESAQGLSSGDPASESHVWVKPFIHSGDQGRENTVPGYKSSANGLVLGSDKLISSQTRAGWFLANVRTQLDGDVGSTDVDIDSYKLGGYASISLDDKTDVNLQLDIGLHSADSTRSIGFAGERARGSFNAKDIHLAAGVGRLMDLPGKATLTPSIRAEYSRYRTDGYTERGADALNLRVGGTTTDELMIDLGVKYTREVDQGMTFVADGGLAYDLMNDSAGVDASLAGGGPRFKTDGLNPSPWLWRGGLGLVKVADNGLEVTARYDVTQKSSGYASHTASVNLRWSY